MSERGGIAGAVGWVGLAVLVFVIFLFFGVCSLFTDHNNDGRSLGRVELVRHDRGCDPDWGECGSGNGNRGYDGEGGRSGDTDQRGDRNCRNICGNTVVIPDPRGDQPPKEQQPQSLACLVPVPFHCDPAPESLFPPSVDGVKQFVLGTIKGGIEMGRLFADTTITFVSNLLVGIA